MRLFVRDCDFSSIAEVVSAMSSEASDRSSESVEGSFIRLSSSCSAWKCCQLICLYVWELFTYTSQLGKLIDEIRRFGQLASFLCCLHVILAL